MRLVSGGPWRRRGPFVLLVFFLLCSILRCAGRPLLHGRNDSRWLLRRVESAFRPLTDAGATWGLAVRDAETGDSILRKRASQLFIPASNIKLVTTACALELLGPDRTFRTVLSARIHGHDSRADGVLDADLVLVGGGDPTLGSADLLDDMNRVFEVWLDSLAQRGVTTLSGHVYGCSGPFPPQPPGRSWAWDNLAFHYAATPAGLCWHDNEIDVTVASGNAVGAPAEMLIAQHVDGIQLRCEVVTAPSENERDLHLHRSPGSWDMVLTGSLPLEKGPVHLSLAHGNPPLYAALTFLNRLEEQGIAVNGEAREGCPGPTNAVEIAAWQSPPLRTIVSITNKKTKNLWADQLLVILGLEVARTASRDRGVAVVESCLKELGLPHRGLRMVDGSGLSRLNLASPDFMTALLGESQTRPWWGAFSASLPIAGQDGTLEKRMQGSAAEGHIRAKTGSMNTVRTLSGFAETLAGRELVFSIMVNGYPGPGAVMDRSIDRVCELLVRYEHD